MKKKIFWGILGSQMMSGWPKSHIANMDGYNNIENLENIAFISPTGKI